MEPDIFAGLNVSRYRHVLACGRASFSVRLSAFLG
jgi:hypothetical protein